jgi:hypothetical protein
MAVERKPRISLYAILARDARVGVVFRRGPSKQVLLLLWHTDTDQFYEGQWFKGRIYERRCDLSPSGKRLIYFAAKYKAPYATWTAVSRPPFLTAVAMWPNGDAWGGGGLFTKEKEIPLNHRPTEMKMAEGFQLYAKEGRIWRLGFNRRNLRPLEQAEMLIDLSDRVFAPKEASHGANQWGGDFQLPEG